MSSSMFVKSDSSTVPTRRSQPTDVATNAATSSETPRTAERRSLSGKFRNLFRRNSASPKRRFNNENETNSSPPPPPPPSAPVQTRTTNEASQLRTPTIPWPFARKTNQKTKPKPLKKSKQKKPIPTVNVEPTTRPAGSVERPISWQSQDSGTIKGFRDFMVIDQGPPTRPTNEMPVDIGVPLPTNYSDRSRSPSTHRDDTTSKIESFIKPEEIPRKTSITQILASNIPINPKDSDLSRPSVHLVPIDLNSSVSSSSSSSADVVVPFEKVNSRTPSVSFGQTSTKYVDSEDFPSSSKENLVIGNDRYPWLTAIVEHHLQTFRKDHFQRSEAPVMSSNIVRRPPRRYEVSTTTDEHYDNRRNHWSNDVPTTHDGHIRPLTPEQTKTSLSSSPFNERPESPVIYRSSTTIYTRDKHSYIDGGELRTWSVREAKPEENSSSLSSSTQRLTNAIHIDRHYYDRSEVEDLTRSSNGFSSIRNTYDYPPNIHFDEKRSNFVDSTSNFEHIDSKQDSSENPVRRYVLKRTDSYDGLGILLSADVDTRLQHCIRDVEPNSPADRIGLRKNDRIIGVNGHSVENVDFADVLLLIKRGLTENHLEFTVINDPAID